VDDREVTQAFVRMGARRAFGPTMHIEGDALLLNGWWQTAFRVAQDAFIVRNEEPPEDSDILQAVAEELSAQGLQQVGVDFPAITAITYAELSLGSVSWALWAADLASGEQALATRAGAESFFGERISEGSPESADYSVEVGGARRIAGLPPSLILTVGLGTAHLEQLQAGLPECRFVSRSFEEIVPAACGPLIPTLIFVDATGTAGREFIMELRADACGRFLPVVALSQGPGVPLGADVALDPAEPPGGWFEPIRRLLP
jgi:hypothetical protein